MKILIPRWRWPSSSKGCDPFDCSHFTCEKYHTNGKKQKRSLFQKAKRTTFGCSRYQCGQVAIPGDTNDQIGGTVS